MLAFPSSVEKYTSNIMNQHVLFNDRDRRGETAIDTIVLARELDLPFLLPAALWFSSTHLATWTHKNIRSLTDADRKAIISAITPLRVAFADYLFGWLDETVIRSANCTQPITCRHAKLLYSLKLWKPPGGKLTFSWRPGAAEGLCRRCVDVGRQHHSEGAKRLWKELPSFFGLSPWEELLAGAPDV
jgi:hypothetical protein